MHQLELLFTAKCYYEKNTPIDYAQFAIRYGSRRQIIHYTECDGLDTFVRVSGDIECKLCGKLYYDHPYCKQSEYESGLTEPYYSLHVTCEGRHVKL
jgi:hypothetical protein